MVLAGFRYLPEALDREGQEALVHWAFDVAALVPWYTPVMYRTGKPMSVRMTCAGRFGWVSDQTSGYRYQEHHPDTGEAWPAIHPILLSVWRDRTGYQADPECCLINWYTDGSKMGMHVDRDEEDQHAPVVSVSVGDEAVYRLGGLARGGSTTKLVLKSGDVVILGGESRFAYHGVSQVRTGSSRRVPEGGRLNFTLRRVTRP